MPVIALQSNLRVAIDWPDGRQTCAFMRTKWRQKEIKITTCNDPPLPPIAIALLCNDMQRIGSSNIAGDLIVLRTEPVEMVHRRMVLSRDDVNMM